MISVSHDYLVVFARQIDRLVWNRLAATDTQLARYANPDDDPRGPWSSVSFNAPNIRPNLTYAIIGPNGKEHWPPKGRCWSTTEDEYLRLNSDRRIWFGSDGAGVPRLKHFWNENPPELTPWTWWPHEEVGHTQESMRELQSLLPEATAFSTPKPERLLHRIVHIGTKPGEAVLDCFVGSGTTAAVAHKMGRRWVAVERSADTVSTYILPRLRKVVDGSDNQGISSSTSKLPIEELPDDISPEALQSAASVLKKAVEAGLFNKADVDSATANKVAQILRKLGRTRAITQRLWSGGGGFRLLDVAPSMFEQAEGQVFLSEWATNGRLAEATAAQLGFDYAPEPPFSGRRGRSRLAVIDGLVNADVVRLLVQALAPEERLVIGGTAVDPAAAEVLRELRPGSTARKIPQSILREYRDTTRWQQSPLFAAAPGVANPSPSAEGEGLG